MKEDRAEEGEKDGKSIMPIFCMWDIYIKILRTTFSGSSSQPHSIVIMIIDLKYTFWEY